MLLFATVSMNTHTHTHTHTHNAHTHCRFFASPPSGPSCASPSRPNFQVEHSRALHRHAPALERERGFQWGRGSQRRAFHDLYPSSRRVPTPRSIPNSTPSEHQLERLAQCAREPGLTERMRVRVGRMPFVHLFVARPPCECERLTFTQLEIFDRDITKTKKTKEFNFPDCGLSQRGNQ